MSTTNRNRRPYFVAGAALLLLAVLGYCGSRWFEVQQGPPPIPSKPQLDDNIPDTWETKGIRQRLIVEKLVRGDISLVTAVAELRELNAKPPVRPDYFYFTKTEQKERKYSTEEVEYRLASVITDLAVSSLNNPDQKAALSKKLTDELKEMKPGRQP